MPGVYSMVCGGDINRSNAPVSTTGDVPVHTADDGSRPSAPEGASVPPASPPPAGGTPLSTYATAPATLPAPAVNNGVTRLLGPESSPATPGSPGTFVAFTPEVLKFAEATGVPPENILRVLVGPPPKTPEEAECRGKDMAELVSRFDRGRYERFRAENPEWFKKHATQLDESFKDRTLHNGPGILFTVGTLLAADALASVVDEAGWIDLDRRHHGEEHTAFVLGSLEMSGKASIVATRSYEIWKNMRAGAGASFTTESAVTAADGTKIAVKGFQTEKNFASAFYKSLAREYVGKSLPMKGLIAGRGLAMWPAKFSRGMGPGILSQRVLDAGLDGLNAELREIYKDSTTPPPQILDEESLGGWGRPLFDAVAFEAIPIFKLLFKKRIAQLVTAVPALGKAAPLAGIAATAAGAGALGDMGMMFVQRLTLGKEKVGYSRFFDQEVAKLVEKEETHDAIYADIAKSDMTWYQKAYARLLTDKNMLYISVYRFISPLTYSADLTTNHLWLRQDADYSMRVTANHIELSHLLQGEPGIAPQIRNILIDGTEQDPDCAMFYYDRKAVDGGAFEHGHVKFTDAEKEFYKKYSWLTGNGNLAPEVKNAELNKLVASYYEERERELNERIATHERGYVEITTYNRGGFPITRKVPVEIKFTPEEQAYYQKYSEVKRNDSLDPAAKDAQLASLKEGFLNKRCRELQDRVALYQLQENLGVLHFMDVDVNDHIREFANDDGAVKPSKGDELLKYAFPGMKYSKDLHEVKDAILLARMEVLAHRIASVPEGSEEYKKLETVRDTVFKVLSVRVSDAAEGTPARRAAEEFLVDARDCFSREAMRGNCRKIIYEPGPLFALADEERKGMLKELDDRVASAQKSGDARALTRAIDARKKMYDVIEDEKAAAVKKQDDRIAAQPEGSEKRKAIGRFKEFVTKTLTLKKPDDPAVPKAPEPEKPKEKTPDERLTIALEGLDQEFKIRQQLLAPGVEDEGAVLREVQKKVNDPICKKYGIKPEEYLEWRGHALSMLQHMAKESDRGKSVDQRISEMLHADGKGA